MAVDPSGSRATDRSNIILCEDSSHKTDNNPEVYVDDEYSILAETYPQSVANALSYLGNIYFVVINVERWGYGVYRNPEFFDVASDAVAYSSFGAVIAGKVLKTASPAIGYASEILTVIGTIQHVMGKQIPTGFYDFYNIEITVKYDNPSSGAIESLVFNISIGWDFENCCWRSGFINEWRKEIDLQRPQPYGGQ